MRSLIIICLAWTAPGVADEALVAVATNFVVAAERLTDDFEAASGHKLTVTSGSTGKLYTQIVNGAPYDLFLSADRQRPLLLEQSGHGVAGNRFTYATGRLALWSADESLIRQSISESLEQSGIRNIAIANPKLAPYGNAAMSVLEALGWQHEFDWRLVSGENVGQAYALVATGNADLGFVALAQVLQDSKRSHGRYLEADSNMHSPIHQDAILLQNGSDNIAAQAFLEFLASDAARTLIRSMGYRAGGDGA